MPVSFMLLIPVSLLILLLQPDLIGAPGTQPARSKTPPVRPKSIPERLTTPLERLSTPLQRLASPLLRRAGSFGAPILQRLISFIPDSIRNWKVLLFSPDDRCQTFCNEKHGFYQVADGQVHLLASKSMLTSKIKCRCTLPPDLRDRLEKEYDKQAADEYARQMIFGSVHEARETLKKMADDKQIQPVVWVTKEKLSQILALYYATVAKKRAEGARAEAQVQAELAAEAQRKAKIERTVAAKLAAEEEEKAAMELKAAAQRAGAAERQAVAELKTATDVLKAAERQAAEEQKKAVERAKEAERAAIERRKASLKEGSPQDRTRSTAGSPD